MKHRKQSGKESETRRREVLVQIVAAVTMRSVLLLTGYLATGTRIMTQGDSQSYLEPGRSLLMHGVFATAGQLEIDRTPGYPIFTMFAGMAWGNVLLAVFVQVLLSSVTLLLVRRIAQRVFPNRNTGVIAGWLYALEPLSMLYCVRLMPETLFTLLLLAAIESILAFQASRKLWNLAAAGMYLAASAYVRPVSLYLGPAVACGLIVTAPGKTVLRLKSAGILLLTFVPPLAIWQMRNTVQTGYSGFSSVQEKNLYFFQAAEVSAELQHISLAEEQERLGYRDEPAYLLRHPDQIRLSRADRLRVMRQEAIRVILAHPALYLRTHLVGMGTVAFTPCATEWMQLLGVYPSDRMPQRIVNAGIVVSAFNVAKLHPFAASTMCLFEFLLLAYYALAVRGASLRSGNCKAIGTLIAFALYFLLVSGGAQAVGRYRLPIMPLICILAAGRLATIRIRLEHQS